MCQMPQISLIFQNSHTSQMYQMLQISPHHNHILNLITNPHPILNPSLYPNPNPNPNPFPNPNTSLDRNPISNPNPNPKAERKKWRRM